MAGPPLGRLPVTFYKSTSQLPPFEDYSMARRTYRYFDGEPLYPFGYGLSYTTFAYRNLQFGSVNVPANGTVQVSVDVVNSGSVAGDEVVQLYLTHGGVAGAPIRALQGFQRVHLEPGESKTVSFGIGRDALKMLDAHMKWVVEPGTFRVLIGSSSKDLRLRGDLVVKQVR